MLKYTSDSFPEDELTAEEQSSSCASEPSHSSQHQQPECYVSVVSPNDIQIEVQLDSSQEEKDIKHQHDESHHFSVNSTSSKQNKSSGEESLKMSGEHYTSNACPTIECGCPSPECNFQLSDLARPCIAFLLCVVVLTMIIGLPMFIAAKNSDTVLQRFPAVEIFEERICKVESLSEREVRHYYCCKLESKHCGTSFSNGKVTSQYCTKCIQHCVASCDTFVTYKFHQVQQNGSRIDDVSWVTPEKQVHGWNKCDSVPTERLHHSTSGLSKCWKFRETESLVVRAGCVRLVNKQGTGPCIQGVPECGNDECFILADPNKTIEMKLEQNKRLRIAGIFFMLFPLGVAVVAKFYLVASS